MAPPSPIKTKKPRGKAQAKEPPKVDKAAEFSTEHSEIERTLNKHRLGHFKIMFQDMTFQWSDGEKNRPLQLNQTNKLRNDMINRGVQRTNPAYRMNGVIDRKSLDGCIYPPQADRSSKPLKLDDVRTLNEDAEYPVIVVKSKGSIRVEMQSGQHRAHLVKEFYEAPSEHWWIVTLYDGGIEHGRLHLANHLDLPGYAKSSLRSNDVVHAVLEGEGDAWMHLVYLKEVMADSTDMDPTLRGQYQLQVRNYEARLGQRTGQIFQVKSYADTISQIIAYPGLRKDFKSGTFESFVIGRNIGVLFLHSGAPVFNHPSLTVVPSSTLNRD